MTTTTTKQQQQQQRHHHHHHRNKQKSSTFVFCTIFGIIIFFTILFVLYSIIGFQQAIGNPLMDNLSLQQYSIFGQSKSGLVHVDVTSTGTKDGVCHPCIRKYIQRIKDIGLFHNDEYHRKTKGKAMMIFNEWEKSLCASSTPSKSISTRPIIIGAGPGTTATRSFALAVNFFGRSVLHYKAHRDRYGNSVSNAWDDNDAKYHVEALAKALYADDYTDWLTVINNGTSSAAASSTSSSTTTNIDFVTMLSDVDAIFDHPFPFYTLDILRSFPNAKILMTHRDPSKWYDRRKEWCSGRPWRSYKSCSTIFLLRPYMMSLDDKGITKEMSTETFYATEEVLRCLVGPDRYLQVDAWDPPRSDDEGGWMIELADLLDVPVSSSMIRQSGCTIPKKTTHSIKCDNDDVSCQKCFQYTMDHRNEYISSLL